MEGWTALGLGAGVVLWPAGREPSMVGPEPKSQVWSATLPLGSWKRVMTAPGQQLMSRRTALTPFAVHSVSMGNGWTRCSCSGPAGSSPEYPSPRYGELECEVWTVQHRDQKEGGQESRLCSPQPAPAVMHRPAGPGPLYSMDRSFSQSSCVRDQASPAVSLLLLSSTALSFQGCVP